MRKTCKLTQNFQHSKIQIWPARKLHWCAPSSHCRQGPAASKAWDPDRAQQAHVAWWVHVDVHRLIKCVESELVARSIDKTTRCVFGVRSVRSCHTLHNIPLIRRRRLWGTLAKKSCPIHVQFVVQSEVKRKSHNRRGLDIAGGAWRWAMHVAIASMALILTAMLIITVIA